VLLMTEKDAVKCEPLVTGEAWVLPVEAVITSPPGQPVCSRQFWRNSMDARLLDILVCPICKANLEYRKAQSELVCKPCRLAFPIRDGIPIMLEDEARPLSEDEFLTAQRAQGGGVHMPFKVVIPARYASTRLPAKPLLDLGGKPMVVRVAERALLSGAEEVVVATDHAEVLEAAERHGLRACADAVPNTRVAPIVWPRWSSCRAGADFFNPNIVKVVLAASGDALYFSRAPIPYARDHFAREAGGETLPIPRCSPIGTSACTPIARISCAPTPSWLPRRWKALRRSSSCAPCGTVSASVWRLPITCRAPAWIPLRMRSACRNGSKTFDRTRI
jgi:uncharacterized protein YbaR (Trm112 family)